MAFEAGQAAAFSSELVVAVAPPRSNTEGTVSWARLYILSDSAQNATKLSILDVRFNILK